MTGALRSLFGILLVIVLVALGVYGLQNQEHVAVYFLFFTFHGTQAWIPAGVFTVLMFAICILYGLFSGTVSLFRRRRLARTSSQHQSRAESLSRELEGARAELARLREGAAARDEERPVAETLGHDRPGPQGPGPQGPRSQEPPTQAPDTQEPERSPQGPGPQGPRSQEPPTQAPDTQEPARSPQQPEPQGQTQAEGRAQDSEAPPAP